MFPQLSLGLRTCICLHNLTTLTECPSSNCKLRICKMELLRFQTCSLSASLYAVNIITIHIVVQKSRRKSSILPSIPPGPMQPIKIHEVSPAKSTQIPHLHPICMAVTGLQIASHENQILAFPQPSLRSSALNSLFASGLSELSKHEMYYIPSPLKTFKGFHEQHKKGPKTPPDLDPLACSDLL